MMVLNYQLLLSIVVVNAIMYWTVGELLNYLFIYYCFYYYFNSSYYYLIHHLIFFNFKRVMKPYFPDKISPHYSICCNNNFISLWQIAYLEVGCQVPLINDLFIILRYVRQKVVLKNKTNNFLSWLNFFQNIFTHWPFVTEEETKGQKQLSHLFHPAAIE